MIIRGTTPTHSFKLPLELVSIDEIRVIYSQKGKPVLIKTMEDMTIDGTECSWKLTQEETFKFKSYGEPIEIQARILTIGNDAIASDIFQDVCGRCLESEVME